MKGSYLPLVLVVGGSLLYHISQKSIPKTAHPPLAMMLAYIVSFTAFAVCAFFYPLEHSLSSSLKELNWAIVTVGLGAAAIEIGFLLAYRSGWGVSEVGLMTNVASALLLMIVGISWFNERLSVRDVIGIALCLAGLVLLLKK
jgi:drug/metabolite transporter (DMT)-like permease